MAVVTAAMVALFSALGVTACTTDEGSDQFEATTSRPLTPSGYAEPDETVAALVAALASDRWDEATSITVGGQMALVALAEGADIETVSDYLQLGDAGVGVNFWAGFTQVTEEFLAASVDDLRVVSGQRYQAGGRPFSDFELASSTSPEGQTFKLTVTQGDDLLWRVDVIATFVDMLALRLSETAEITRATQTRDAAVVSAELARHVPSLEAALTDPGLSPELTQGVLSALSAIQ